MQANLNYSMKSKTATHNRASGMPHRKGVFRLLPIDGGIYATRAKCYTPA
jgi:hypothetical protein